MIKKEFERQNKTGNPQTEWLDEKKLSNIIFYVALFMKQKQGNKARKQGKKTTKKQGRKKNKKTGKGKNKKQERERERERYIYIYAVGFKNGARFFDS